MDGRGRSFDNIFVERLWRSVKHEDVYLKGYASMDELLVGLADYFAFYNGERPHQSLDNKTPDVVYRSAIGGGAMIVDKFGGAVEGIRAGGGGRQATGQEPWRDSLAWPPAWTDCTGGVEIGDPTAATAQEGAGRPRGCGSGL